MNRFNFSDLLNNHQIILLGDDHNMNQGREWLAKEIKKGKLNVDFVALEYVEVNKQYLTDKKDDNELKVYLKNSYKDFPGFDAESILGIINVCHDLGIKVLGIEMPAGSFADWHQADAQKERMKFLSNQVIKLTKLGRGVVLLGADHVEKEQDNVFQKVQESVGKDKVASVIFIGGKNWSSDTEDYWIRGLEAGAKDRGLDNQFYIEPGGKQIPADWIIHFPQTKRILNE